MGDSEGQSIMHRPMFNGRLQCAFHLHSSFKCTISFLLFGNCPVFSAAPEMRTAPGSWWHNKWLALVGAIWICTASGLTYVFSIFSSALKTSVHYSQQQIDLIGTASDMGGNVGLICGALSTYLPDWAMLAIGGIANLIGYGMLWLTASGQIEPLPFWQVCFFMWLGVNGSTFYNTVALVTCVRNFPRSRGVVVGLLKGMVGLSGALYTQIYAALLAPDQVAFLLVLAVGPTCSALLAIFILRPAPKDDVAADKDDERYIRILFVSAIALAAYLMADILLSTIHPFTQTQRLAALGGMLGLLASPLAIPLWIQMAHHAPRATATPEDPGSVSPGTDSVGGHRTSSHMEIKARAHGDVEDASLSCPLLPSGPEQGMTPGKGAWESPGKMNGVPTVTSNGAAPPGTGGTSCSGATSWVKGPVSGLPDFTVMESLRQLDLWLLVLSMTCGVGSALTVLDNLAQIGAAQGYPNVAIPVALVSIWNFAGRVGGGFYSERLLRNYGLPRPAMIGAAQGLMAIGHLLFAFALPGSLYAASLIVGAGLGVTYGMVTAAASELFGLTSFGMVYNIITTAIPVGSYLFSGVLAGYVYDREAGAEGRGLSTMLGGKKTLRLDLSRKMVGNVWSGLAKEASSLFAMEGPNQDMAMPWPDRSVKPVGGTTASRGSARRTLIAAVPSTQDRIGSARGGGLCERFGVPNDILTGVRSSRPEDECKCTGAHCFRLTFIVMAIVCLVGMFANFALAHRARGLYKRLQRSLNEGDRADEALTAGGRAEE